MNDIPSEIADQGDGDALAPKPRFVGPRTDPGYDNRIHGRSSHVRLRLTTDMQAEPPFNESEVWNLLYANGRPKSGRFIPGWTICATGTEARAALLAEINWWFEPAFKEQKKADEAPGVSVVRRARARVYDDDGYQWLTMSARQLADRIMVPKSTASDALRYLEGKGLIAVMEGDSTSDALTIRPCARPIAAAFHEATGDATALREYLDPRAAAPYPDWTSSLTQAAAFHNTKGITVHDVLIAALHGDLWLARLLSQILWYFGDRMGNCKAKIRIDGQLWLAKSHAALGRELNKSPESVRRGLDALVDDHHVLTRCVSLYRPGRWSEAANTTHLRPNVSVLLELIRKHLPEAGREHSDAI